MEKTTKSSIFSSLFKIIFGDQVQNQLAVQLVKNIKDNNRTKTRFTHQYMPKPLSNEKGNLYHITEKA